MKTTEIPKKNIVALETEFSSYEMPEILAIPCELFVYKYHVEPYSGNGFAAWNIGKDWFYHELGHCSCNGPTDGIGKSKMAAVTFKQLKEIAEKSYNEDSKPVIEYIEKHV